MNKETVIDTRLNTILFGNTKYYDVPKEILSYIEQLEQKCESLLENKNETLRYISNYLALDQRYKWNDNVDEKLKLVKKFLNGREKTIMNISYEDLLRQNKQLKNNRDKAIEYVEHHKFNKFGDIDCNEAEDIIDILKGDNK